MNIRKVIYRTGICLLLSTIPAYFILPQYIPQVQVLSHSASPNGEWEAVVQNEDYGITIFDPQYNAVILKPLHGIMRFLQTQKVLMIPVAGDTTTPHVQWNGNNELNITLDKFDITYVDTATASTYAKKPLGICLQTISRSPSPDKRHMAVLEDWNHKDSAYYNLRLISQDVAHQKQEITLHEGTHSPNATHPQIAWQDNNNLVLKREQKDYLNKLVDNYKGIKISLHWNEN
ncbi:MAG TPA: hypothetical protein VFT64_06045 [Rickettsiales bacterium]|nr:hypothetical protein [Rickettsiales bacterium]